MELIDTPFRAFMLIVISIIVVPSPAYGDNAAEMATARMIAQAALASVPQPEIAASRLYAACVDVASVRAFEGTIENPKPLTALVDALTKGRDEHGVHDQCRQAFMALAHALVKK